MHFEASAAEIAELVLDGANLHRWCGSVFMHGELVSPGDPDGRGMTLRFHTKGWMPHSFFLEARIAEGIRHRYMRIEVSGDFEGFGELWLVPKGPCSSRIDLRWRTDIRYRWIRLVARVVPSVFAWNHLWAMANLQRSLQRELLRRRGEPAGAPATATFPHSIPQFQRLQRRIGGYFSRNRDLPPTDRAPA